jgi:hypothetical protein
MTRPSIVTEMPAVRLPGGPVLSAMSTSSVPSEGEVTRSLLGQLQAALAPLMPFFKMLDTILALKDLAQAIPDALGPPPDPSKLAEAVSKVLSSAESLAQLVPQLSVPILIRDLVVLLVRFLSSLETDLLAIEGAQERATEASTQADAIEAESPDGAARLRAAATLGGALAGDQLAGLVAAAAPVVAILDIVGLLASLAGLPAPPSLSVGGADVSVVREAVTAVREALEIFVAPLL